MAKKKKIKISLISIVLLAIAVVGVVLACIGLGQDWLHVKGSLTESKHFYSLSDLDEIQDVMEKVDVKCYGASKIVSIIAVVVAGIAVLLSVGTLFIRALNLDTLTKAVGGLAVLLGIVAIILSIVFANSFAEAKVVSILTSEANPAVGAWFASVGSIVAGALVGVESSKR